MQPETRTYNSAYAGAHLARVAFPLGGIGAGMICLEGSGAFSHVSARGKLDFFNEPLMFSALWIGDGEGVAKLLEGPVPSWKLFGPAGTGNGGGSKSYGLPRFEEAVFEARFPFATLRLDHPAVPLRVELTAWSPFTPLDADNASLPVAAVEYRFLNPTARRIEAVYSFHARNFMAVSQPELGGPLSGGVLAAPGGFTLWQPSTEGRPFDEGAFAAAVDDRAARVNCAWFRGGWYDPLTVLWKTLSAGEMPAAGELPAGEIPSPGGSLYVPFALEPGEERTVRLRLGWYVPETDMQAGRDPAGGPATCACGPGRGEAVPPGATHRPWYARAFPNVQAVMDYWGQNYVLLRERSKLFADTFYDSTLPPEVTEAVAANLTILKSPTVLRQADGRLWAWEGCFDTAGCCHGSCTHVWNYAQALPHLFPALERSLRETEFCCSQNERGHQSFRSNLPIRPATHDFHAAADGQLGGIMKAYREWRISGDLEWLRGLWPQIKQSLDYCIDTWDPTGQGVLREPHHNTYDIEFWGPDGMCTSFYLGALQAAMGMARALGDDPSPYETLYARGRAAMESALWNGEYFIQKVEWHGLRAGDPTQAQTYHAGYTPEARAVLEKEGPKYQYGTGCLSDGVLGAWMAQVCGVGDVLAPDKVASHLAAVHHHNFRADLSDHVNPQRPTFAAGHEGGLLLCTWPHGDKLTLPFPYSDEVWTGIEYQVASHLMLTGQAEAGLEIVRAARDRYDGRVRNPFNEYECGHWYARAMSSYGLLQGLTGVRYDAVDKVLHIEPAMAGDFRSFLCTATGYGTVGVENGQPFLKVVQGTIPCERVEYTAYR